jgi:hypothetical protein
MLGTAQEQSQIKQLGLQIPYQCRLPRHLIETNDAERNEEADAEGGQVQTPPHGNVVACNSLDTRSAAHVFGAVGGC